jgi:hypothetical protein
MITLMLFLRGEIPPSTPLLTLKNEGEELRRKGKEYFLKYDG